MNSERVEKEIEKIILEKDVSDALDMVFAAYVDDDNEPATEYEALPQHEHLLTDIVGSLKSNHGLSNLWKIAGVNCSAHTLQLAIHDALKKLPKGHINILSLCRCVAKHLRLQTTVNELNEINMKFKLPRLDVNTRWCSTYLMV